MFAFLPIQVPIVESIPAALVSVVKSRYGVVFADVGLTEGDLTLLDQIDLGVNKELHYFGDLEGLSEQVANFTQTIGDNSFAQGEAVACCVTKLAQAVLSASGREEAWVYLRSSVKGPAYDTPYWHMDGYYYHSTQEPQYKLACTLKGPATLFYPLEVGLSHFRRIIWMNMNDRKFMGEVCMPEFVFYPSKGIASVFLAGDFYRSAIHSQPPISENRLFFSMVPCKKQELLQLKKKLEKK